MNNVDVHPENGTDADKLAWHERRLPALLERVVLMRNERDAARAERDADRLALGRLQQENRAARAEVDLMQSERAEVERLRREHEIAKRELNEARVEVERVKSQSAARDENVCEEINARVSACMNHIWLERDKMIAERDAGRNRLKEVFDANERLIAQRDEARADVTRVRNELQQMQCAGFDEHFRPTYVRPEPSRLEIAAMLLAGWFCNFDNPDALACPRPKWWIEQADALIAAEKEGK
jgi:chromosome segregation ATPase